MGGDLTEHLTEGDGLSHYLAGVLGQLSKQRERHG
jgi:hypothetical protein